jgi:hypothetical protein
MNDERAREIRWPEVVFAGLMIVFFFWVTSR